MYKEITPVEVQERMEGLHIIDVREDVEVAEGKIPTAIHIALGELSQRLHELDKEKEYIIVCRSGMRSGKACEFLTTEGYRVQNMSGGMLAWQGEVQ